MATLKKFVLPKPGISSIPMPSGAVVHSAGIENGYVVIWASCKGSMPELEHRFLIVPSDMDFPDHHVDSAKFIATLMFQKETPKGLFQAILHVFDLGEGSGIIVPH